MRHKAIGATAALAVVPLLVAPAGHAEVGVPKLDGPCSAEQSGAMTALPDGATFLSCLGGAGAGYRWRAVESPFAPSTRWLSYGRALKLHGEGLRNPQIQAGDWIGVPQDPDSRCRAEQEAVVSAGEVGPAQVATGESGQPLSLTVVHSLFSIELTGKLLVDQAGRLTRSRGQCSPRFTLPSSSADALRLGAARIFIDYRRGSAAVTNDGGDADAVRLQLHAQRLGQPESAEFHCAVST